MTECFQLYGHVLYRRHRPYYPLEHALYSILNHTILIPRCICTFIFLETSGVGKLFFSLLRSDIFIDVFYNR